MATVELSNVRKCYDQVEVLRDINLSIQQGEFMVFVGPSGCGKSTLLRMIAGLEDITDGDLLIDGELMNDRLPAERGVSMVFQSYALYPHMNVFENMAFGLEQAKLPRQAIKERVEEAAHLLQISDLMDRKPKQLSGGQRQRVAIGRAITRKPRVFLFDEPLSNLDAALRADTRVEIARLHEKLKDTTMIYVTHDQYEAMTLADRIVVLNGGKIEQVGTPMELFDKPASQFVASFIGSPKMNFISGEVAQQHRAHLLGLRPEDITATQDKGEWQGQVILSEALGSDTYLHVETSFSDKPLVVRAPGRMPFTPRGAVYLTPDMTRAYRFDAHGMPLV